MGEGSNLEARSGRIIMRRLLKDLRTDDRGVTMIEYALIAGLISVVAIALLTAMGGSVKNIFTSINNALTTA
jgi:pilus assembly protein Flp/PilA